MFGSRTYYRKTLILLAIGISICGAYSLWDPLKWVDSLFLIGLLFLVVAGAVTVWQGGFFRVFVMGFRKQFGRWENDYDPADHPADSPQKKSHPWVIPSFLTAGCSTSPSPSCCFFCRGTGESSLSPVPKDGPARPVFYPTTGSEPVERFSVAAFLPKKAVNPQKNRPR